MKPARFDYYRPETVDEALSLLRELGSEAKVLAGGQSLVPVMNMRLAAPTAVIDINALTELDAFGWDAGELQVGALVRQAALERAPTVRQRTSLLAAALPFVGHRQTRSRGTLCGSLAHADPSAELPLVMVALGGELDVRSQSGRRSIPASTFFQSYFTTELEAEELVVAARLPADSGRRRYAFEEFAQRHGDFALASAACAVECDDTGKLSYATLVLGGVDERPFVVDTADLVGRLPEDEMIATACERAAIGCDPPSDHHASAAYRRQLARTLAGRVLRRALAPLEAMA